MLLDEFTKETDKLEKFYGKELDQYEKDIWYQELKKLPVERYIQVIKKVFVESKFMPKLADIVLINRELPYKTEIPKEKINCSKCKGNGFITYTRLIQNGDKKIPYDFIARCDCKNGEQHKYNGDDYYVPTLAQIGL